MPKILIVAPSWIGDTLLAQPLLARLKKKLPGAVIDALAPQWTAPVLQRMPEINEVIEAPFGHGEIKLPARWRLLYSLNPLVGVIDGFRWAILGRAFTLYWSGLFLAATVVALLVISGLWYFRKAERSFADVI